VAAVRFKAVRFWYDKANTDFVFGDFEVHDSSCVAVVGRSGVGKSTLLSLAAGLLQPKEGEVRVSGQDPTSFREAGRLSMVFQSASLLPWRTAKENVCLPFELRQRLPDDSRIDQALRLVGLESDSHLYPDQLSGGMKSRAAFARALATNPELLLLDEPFGSLDEVTRVGLVEDFVQLRRQMDVTTILVTHNISEALYLADSIFVLTGNKTEAGLEIRVMEGMDQRGRWPGYREMLGTRRYRDFFGIILRQLKG